MTGPTPLASLSRPMTDPFGRTISYLRVSVTDRCDLRCFYCMSEDMTFLPKADLLTEAAADRRRTAGPAQRDVAGALAVAPPR
jgi:cyclic pyranopterin phosphate synthase